MAASAISGCIWSLVRRPCRYGLAGVLLSAGLHWTIHPAEGAVASGQVITIAGNGTSGFSGDNGPALAASFSGPTGLAVGPDGTLYVADSGNYRIRTIHPVTGLVSTIAGNGTFGDTGNGGPATAAALSSFFALAID